MCHTGWMVRALCGLLLWTSLACGQPPSDADAAAMIERARAKALAYEHSLPDFVCAEVIRRYSQSAPTVGYNFRGGVDPSAPAKSSWIPTDKLTVILTFFQQKEEHKLIAIDGEPTDWKYDGLTGGVGAGEFGGTLESIFNPLSQTAFYWKSWKEVRKHRAAIYTYRVETAHSSFVVIDGEPGKTHQAVVGFHGYLEIDNETGELLRFTYLVDDIPKNVKLDHTSTTVDYDFADVGGRRYLLPAHSISEIYSPRLPVRTETEFHEYHKFSSDSVIKFGDGQ